MPSIATQAGVQAPQRTSTLVFLLASLVAFGPLSIDMYLPAFPQIAESYGVELVSIQLSLTAFFVGLAIGQLFMGPISDRWGRKLPLYIGLTVYALASLACAFSQRVEHLILLRFFQAVGACAGMVVSRAVVRDLFTPQESARVFSLLILVMGVAPILAPLMGGYITVTLGWRAIFLILALLSLVSLTCVTKFLRETHPPDSSFLFRGVFRRYFSIVRDREFIGYALSGGIAQAGMFAYITGSPFVFIGHFGVSPENYGWIFGGNALGLIALSQLNGRLLLARSADQILGGVMLVLTAASVSLITAAVLDLSLVAFMIPLFLYISILGMSFPNSTAGALAGQGHQAGSASALLGTLQFVFAALASGVVSKLHNGTVLPMVSVMGGCGILAMLVYFGVVRRGRVAGVISPAPRPPVG